MRDRLVLGCGALLAAAVIAVAGRAGASPLPAAPGCPIFPATDVWNKPVDTLPVAANSAAMVRAIGLSAGRPAHPELIQAHAPLGVVLVVAGSRGLIGTWRTARGYALRGGTGDGGAPPRGSLPRASVYRC